MTDAARSGNGQSSDASIAELVKQLSEQTSRLARQEVELAMTIGAEPQIDSRAPRKLLHGDRLSSVRTERELVNCG